MPSTPRLNLPYPAPGDPADVPVDVQELAAAVDLVVAGRPRWGGVLGDATVWVPGSNDWTASRLGAGHFYVGFNVPFATFPLVTVIPAIGFQFTVGLDNTNTGLNGFAIALWNVPNAAQEDCTFMFSAWEFKP